MKSRLKAILPVATALIAVAVLATVVAGIPSSAPVPAVPNTGPAPAVYSNPYDAVQPFMDGIYAADRDVEPTPDHRIRAVIVPHHLVASPAIASGIRMLQGQAFKRILLLSPDHSHKCPTPLCTVDGVYRTAFGDVRAATETLDALRSSPLVTEDAGLFKVEHGIHAVVPFIAKYLPDVPVTPLVLSQRLPWKAERSSFLDLLMRAVDDDTVLVVSSDFSHYLPLSVAERMDELTAEAIFAKDLDGIAALDNADQSDCPGCLWFLATLADSRGFYNPSVLLHTNSAGILHDERIPATTSHFSMVWYENDALDGGDLAVAGDVTFTRGTAALPQPVLDWWAGDGPRFVNLEGPLAKRCAQRKNPFIFCNSVADWAAAKDLATHWGVENNHMLDLGRAGRAETSRLVAESGEIAVTTSPWEDARFRLIALTALVNPVGEAGSADISGTHAAVLDALAEPRPEKLTLVYVHGGEEYHALTGAAEERVWEGFIDAGADAVLVSHSHVPGDVRIYKGKPIFRGLGNFIFDQRDTVATSTAKMVRLRKINGRILFETILVRTP